MTRSWPDIAKHLSATCQEVSAFNKRFTSRLQPQAQPRVDFMLTVRAGGRDAIHAVLTDAIRRLQAGAPYPGPARPGMPRPALPVQDALAILTTLNQDLGRKVGSADDHRTYKIRLSVEATFDIDAAPSAEAKQCLVGRWDNGRSLAMNEMMNRIAVHLAGGVLKVEFFALPVLQVELHNKMSWVNTVSALVLLGTLSWHQLLQQVNTPLSKVDFDMLQTFDPLTRTDAQGIGYNINVR